MVDIVGNAWAVPDNPSSLTTIFHGILDIIGPSYTEWETKVGNTYPYDGAAGGYAKTNGDIAYVQMDEEIFKQITQFMALSLW